MKALIISSLLFFSLRAMSSEVGQNLKGECKYGVQSARKVEPKNVVVSSSGETQKAGQVISK